MISFIKKILTPQKSFETNKITGSDSLYQMKMEDAQTKEPTKDEAMSSENSVDSSEDLNLNPSVVLTDCCLKSHSLESRVDNKSNAHSNRRSQRKSSKVAAKKIAKMIELSDTYPLVTVNRGPSQRLCAKVAVRKIADIIDGSSSESEEDRDSGVDERE